MQPRSGSQIVFRRKFNIDLQMDDEWCAGDESRMPIGLPRPNFDRNYAANIPSTTS
jgi:hypothetical protein